MLTEIKLKQLNDFIQSASIEELIYASGYIEGFRVKGSANILLPGTDMRSLAPAVIPTIVYATETGNAKRVATQLLAGFKRKKIYARSVDIQQFSIAQLKKEETILFVISTQGDGDLPVTAERFYKELTESSGELSTVSYSIFGLGDTSYPLFCHAAILLNEALSAKGAKEIRPVVKAGLDYASLATEWEDALLSSFSSNGHIGNIARPVAQNSTSHKRNYTGIVSHKVILNDIGSGKTTYHIEIDPEEEIHYLPGDALGIIPRNKATAIQPILRYFGIKEDALFELKNKTRSAYEWLEHLNIKGLSKKRAQQVAVLFNQETGAGQTDLLDLISGFEHGLKPRFADLLKVLSEVPPRLYSISSSKEAHEGQVHLTVNLNTFYTDGQKKLGLASDYLGDLEIGSSFSFYIHSNPNFRLPEEDKDIIMIGPGTGIAPFRSFLAQRDVTGAAGRNWLFFGEQRFVQDFYYQTEIQEWIGTGILTRLSTAFSRDQEHKIYVQDRIKEQAKEFNQWIEDGATIYICGQKSPMSHDVEQAIIEVLAEERKTDRDTAMALLETLETGGRFLKDVY